MAVYNMGSGRERSCESMKIHQSSPRNIAADIPPESEMCSDRSDYKSSDNSPFRKIIDDFLDGGIDSDKLLIAVLLYLLIKEGADIKLIIALGYILI